MCGCLFVCVTNEQPGRVTGLFKSEKSDTLFYETVSTDRLSIPDCRTE